MSAMSELQDEINKTGQVSEQSSRKLREAIFGKKTRFAGASKQVQTIAAGGVPKITQIGENIDDFGEVLIWDRKDEEITIIAFVNAKDPFGVSISNLKATDAFQVTDAAGLAFFSKDKGNKLVSSIIGLIAAAGKGLAPALGVPEAAPFIAAGEEFANKQFEATNEARKPRTAFGDMIDGNDAVARQEGGILITLPAAGGPYMSGKSTKRWIKSKDSRDPVHNPDHVKHGFFLTRTLIRQTKPLGADGLLHITPWDHIFPDNAGFYRVILKITQNAPQPVVQ